MIWDFSSVFGHQLINFGKHIFCEFFFDKFFVDKESKANTENTCDNDWGNDPAYFVTLLYRSVLACALGRRVGEEGADGVEDLGWVLGAGVEFRVDGEFGRGDESRWDLLFSPGIHNSRRPFCDLRPQEFHFPQYPITTILPINPIRSA